MDFRPKRNNVVRCSLFLLFVLLLCATVAHDNDALINNQQSVHVFAVIVACCLLRASPPCIFMLYTWNTTVFTHSIQWTMRAQLAKRFCGDLECRLVVLRIVQFATPQTMGNIFGIWLTLCGSMYYICIVRPNALAITFRWYASDCFCCCCLRSRVALAAPHVRRNLLRSNIKVK